MTNLFTRYLKVQCIQKVFEQGIYYLGRGEVFVVALNVSLHDVTKHVFEVAIFKLKGFLC